MEINEATIQAMITCLQQTMSSDPSLRKPAEQALESNERKQNYPIILLQLIDRDQIDLIIRVAASITFKNFIKRNWSEDDQNLKISISDRNAIKNIIVSVMLKREDQIQRQLSDAVAIIGKEDFPEKWPNLLGELVERIKTSAGNFQIVNGILQTVHSLIKRFRHEFKSDELYKTIKFVLDNFASAFTDLFVATMNLTIVHQNDQQTLKVLYSSLILCVKIFYSLNAQDLPEFFEDNLSIWMPNFLKILTTETPSLETDSEDEVGLSQQVKTEICDVISMYAQKYHEEFEPFLPLFLEAVWNLLTKSGQESKYDNLISNAIKFLSTVANRPQFKKLFEEPGVLDSLCSRVIIPNIELRQYDIELFEDNCEDYIRADIEGSDIDTRRKSACDLVKSLAKHFEADIVRVFSEYIKIMLDSFASNQEQHWKNKDAAIYLVTAICVKGSTAKYGTTQTTDLVNVKDFYKTFIKSDIDNANDVNTLPILRADALKYLMTFRNQLPFDEIILPSIPIIIRHLASSSVVVHTYAANCLEKIFTLESATKERLIKQEHLSPFLGPLITSLFGVLTLEGSSENEYVMKAIMRTIAISKNSIQPFLNPILTQLNTKLMQVCKNPSKPHFNHYLFESIAISLQIALNHDPASATAIENSIFELFRIFSQDVQEFLPYIIQLLSLLLEQDPANQIPDNYLNLLNSIVAPDLWEKSCNVHPLVRLLKAYIRKSPQQIVSSGRIEAMLGIFQKLVASRLNDHEGLDLLQSMFQYLPINSLEKYIQEIFLILFTRLSKSKTAKYVSNLILFFSFFIYKFGPQSLQEVVDRIQPNMFGMVIERLFIAESKKVSGRSERKSICVALTKLLTELPPLIEGQYSSFWSSILETLIGVFELPIQQQEDEEIQQEIQLQLEENLGYQTTYCKLMFAAEPQFDLINSEVQDAKLYLVKNLQQLSVNRPGFLMNITRNVDPSAVNHLNSYFTAANVVLA